MNVPSLKLENASYSDSTSNDAIDDAIDDYIEMPPNITSYHLLKTNDRFDLIEKQLLKDINQIQQLVHKYVDDEFYVKINNFKDSLKTVSTMSFDTVSVFYTITRENIHLLANALVLHQKKQAFSLMEEVTKQEKIELGNILLYCLEGIEKCLTGINVRFDLVKLQLKVINQDVDAIFKKAEIDCYRDYVNKYALLFLKGGVSEGEAVHVFSDFYNCYCHNFGLPKLVDDMYDVGEGAKRSFISYCELYVNKNTIFSLLVNQYFFQLYTILHNNNKTHWLTRSFLLSSIEESKVQTELEMFIMYFNHLIDSSESISLLSIFNIQDDGDSVDMSRCKEKIRRLLAKSSVRRNKTILKNKVYKTIDIPNSNCCIRTENNLYFFVVEKSNCQLENLEYAIEQTITLQLSHLMLISFTQESMFFYQALLQQALDQTEDPKEIINFFMDITVCKQFEKTDQRLNQFIVSILDGKFVEITESVLVTLIIDNMHTHQRLALFWISKSVLFVPLMMRLKELKNDVIPILEQFDIDRFFRLSNDELIKILSDGYYPNLIEQAKKSRYPYLLWYLLPKNDLLSYLDKDKNTIAHILLTFAQLDQFKELVTDNPQILLIDNANGINVPMLAVSLGEFEIIRWLINERKLDIQLRSSTNSTLLIEAIKSGYEEIIYFLIENDIDVHALNDEKMSALTVAIKKKNKVAVELLINKKVDINEVGEDNKTPLMLALECENESIATLLIKKGADVTVEDLSGCTAFMVAVKYGYIEIVKECFSSVDINQENKIGLTALMLAIQEKRLRIIRYFIDNDVNVNYQNKKGITALMYAVQYNNKETVTMLLDALADVTIKNNKGKMALDYIDASKGSVIAEKLLSASGYIKRYGYLLRRVINTLPF